MGYYDDYDDYIAEEEEKINAIIDEQAIYDIASKKVKEKLSELTQTLKDSESTRKRLVEDISKLEKENKELKEKTSELEKEKSELVVSLTEEQIKEEERKRNPWGLTEGDTCYHVDYFNSKYDCPICNGEKKITLNGENFTCPKCHGYGYLEKRVYDVRKRKVQVVGWYYDRDFDRYYLGINADYKYVDHLKDGKPNKVFKDKESAEKRCKELNDKEE